METSSPEAEEELAEGVLQPYAVAFKGGFVCGRNPVWMLQLSRNFLAALACLQTGNQARTNGFTCAPDGCPAG